MKWRYLSSLIVLAVALSANAQEEPKTLKGALAKWLEKKLSLREQGCEKPPRIESVKYHDFDGDKRDELIVTANTCLTGTAGFDVHMVVSQSKLQTGERFIEWLIPQLEGSLYDRAKMTNSRNYTLSVKDEFLVATWYDESDREAPLTIKYKALGTAADPDYKFAVYDIVYGK